MTTSTDQQAVAITPARNPDGEFVVASSIVIDVVGCAALETAFQNRLRAVEGTPGYRGLQVWREPREPGKYLMVSWWDSRDSWAAYMRSSEHDESHARMPTAPARPRPAGLRTYEVVAR